MANGWVTATMALLVAAIWLALHRHNGIVHDGVLYAAQALQHLDPAAFRGDLFFAYGSQGEYTIFTSLYAQAIELLGLPLAAAILLAAAQLVWLTGLVAALRAFLQGQAFWVALLLVIALPRGYGSAEIFSYAEPFLTARPWAEAVSLLAVALAIRGKGWFALAILVVATVLHPPMALPAAVLVLLAGFDGRTRMVLGGGGVAALLVLATLGIQPFSLLWVPMDAVWLQIASGRSPFAFISHWHAGDFREPLLLGTLLAMAAACATGTARRAWLGGIGAFSAGAGLSLLGAAWPSALLVQLQPWRAMWLVKVMAIAAAVWLVREYWPRSVLNRIIIATMAAALLSAQAFGPIIGIVVALAFVAHNRDGFDPPLRPIISVGVWAVVTAVVAEHFGTSVIVGMGAFNAASAGAWPLALFSFLDETAWLLAPAAGMTAWWLMHRLPSTRYALLPAVAIGAGYCAAHWDDRASGQRQALHRMQSLAANLERHAPRGHLLYWDGDLAVPWLALRRGNYASPMQGAGVIFSAATAREFVRRGTRLSLLAPQQDRLWQNSAAALPVQVSVDTAAGLVHLCHDPVLDYVVLARDVGIPSAQRIAAGAWGGPFDIHDCAVLRQFPDHYAAD